MKRYCRGWLADPSAPVRQRSRGPDARQGVSVWKGVQALLVGLAVPFRCAALTVRSSASTPRIDAYVINLDERRDRCECMSAQLAGAPSEVRIRRQRAVPADACGLGDDEATLYGDRNHEKEKSLFCSNYQIWQHASAEAGVGHDDVIVILEDDAMLKPGFWSSITDFVASCGQKFDYLSVDSWKADGHPERDRTSTCGPQAVLPLYRPSPSRSLDYWGTHVQVIRRSFLPTLIERAKAHGMGPMDVWWMMRINDGRSFSWQPGIASQARFRQSRAAELLKTRAARSCAESVAVSDIEAYFQRGVARLRCGGEQNNSLQEDGRSHS